MLEQKKHAGGRRRIPDELKAMSTGWSFRRSFIRQVEEASIRDGAASTSEWIRDRLTPHLSVPTEHAV